MSDRLVFCDFNVKCFIHNEERRNIIDLFNSFNLKITSDLPTRIHFCRDSVQREQKLDYLVTDSEFVDAYVVLPNLGDHLAQICVLKKTEYRSVTKPSQSKRVLEFNMIKASIRYDTFNDVYNAASIDEKYKELASTVMIKTKPLPTK